MSAKYPPSGPPPSYRTNQPQYPNQHYASGYPPPPQAVAAPPGGEAQSYYGSGAPVPQPYFPPQTYQQQPHQKYPPFQQQYPHQQQYHQHHPYHGEHPVHGGRQKKERGTAGSIIAALFGALACCCCLDCIF